LVKGNGDRIVTVDKVGRARVAAGGGGHGAGLFDGEPLPQWRDLRPSAVAKEIEDPTGRPGRPGRHEVGGPRPERCPVGLSHPRHGAVDSLLQPPGHGATFNGLRRPNCLHFYDLGRAPAGVAEPAAEGPAKLGLRLRPEAARQDRRTRDRPCHGCGCSSGDGARAYDGELVRSVLSGVVVSRRLGDRDQKGRRGSRR
jgi:hypothetical protein